MDILIDGQLVSVSGLTTDFLPPPAALDGEVSSAAEITTIVSNAANAGKSYYMRGGGYGSLTISRARPASLITFKTYPGEQVIFGDLRFEQTTNIRFDGNSVNTFRAPAGGYPNGSYGLWFRGSGTVGDGIPPVPGVIVFADTSATEGNDNIQFANFRVGDTASTDQADWRRQHGIVFAPFSSNILFEDFQISYLGADLVDMAPTGAGDAEGGGYGLWWAGTGTNWGDYTFRRGHWSRMSNDFIQYGPKNATAQVLFEDCLLEGLQNFGDAHADMFQNFGGSQAVTFDGCAFRNGTDFLLHGNNPGGTRLFSNCLFDTYHQIVMSKDDESGPSDYEFRDCTLLQPLTGTVLGLRTDSTAGAAYTSNCVVSNSIYGGIVTQTNITRDAVYSDDGQPNLVLYGGTGRSTDIPATPTFDSQQNCTSHAQGWRKPVTFPWTLGAF